MLLTIPELHDKIDLDLQVLGSNRFGMLDGYAKDMYINQALEDILNDYYKVFTGAVKDMDVSVVEDVRTNYGNLSNFYEKTIVYNPVFDNNECIVPLPNALHITNLVNSGFLFKGETYYVATAGSTNLSSFGYKAVPVLGEMFTCNLADINPTSVAPTVGATYKIKNAANINLVPNGASSNKAGTIFVCTNATVTGSSADCKLEQLSATPSWSSTILTVNSNSACFRLITCKPLLGFKYVINAGAIKKNAFYKVIHNGTTMNWSTFFGYAVVKNDDIHHCIFSGSPTWTASGQLREVRFTPASLVTPDVDMNLQYPYNSSEVRPTYKLMGSNIVIPVNNFDIYAVELSYLRKPVKIDHTIPMALEYDESFHNYIALRTAKLIAAVTVNPNYQPLQIESKE